MAKWKETLGAVAPTLARALGGPVAGMATEAIAMALGLPAGASEKDIAAKVETLTGADWVNLQKAEMDFEVRLEELNIKKDQLDAADRDSARKREIATKDKTPQILGLSIVLGFFTVLGTLIYSGASMDPAALTIVESMIGALGAMTVQVCNYFFGSSRGSKAKTELIKSMQKGGE